MILKTPTDWDAWNKQFKAKAKQKNLLDHVNSTGIYLIKPIQLDIKWFLPDQTQTRAARPARTEAEAAAAVENPTMIDLTSDGYASYQLAYTVYRDQWEQYEKQ